MTRRERPRDPRLGEVLLPGNRLGLGDEFDASRAWRGSIHHLAVFDRALTETVIADIFAQGPEP